LLPIKQFDFSKRSLRAKKRTERISFADFVVRDRPDEWQDGAHIRLLCDTLERVAAGDPDYKRVMVFMPPRHIKSETVSRKFPAWYLGNYPDNSIILCSYAADLAEGFSRIARNTLMERSEWFGGVTVASDSRSVSDWHTAGRRGGMVAAGVGGPIAGKGANIALIDDPVKNSEEAASETVREHIWDWYRSTFRTRLTPGGAIVLVMTRWHEDDLAGRLLAEQASGGEQWRVISLPAIAEANDLLGRPEGEPLWPQMFPLTELEPIKRTLGSYLWSALYQQRPSPEEGLRFHRSWFRYFTDEGDIYTLHRPGMSPEHVRKSECFTFQTVDPAASEKETADFFVCSTWAKTPGNTLLLLDVFREHAETTKHEQILRDQLLRHNSRLLIVEQATFGINIIQALARKGLPVIGVKADRDKLSRSLPLAARYEAGAVYHRKGAPWLGICEDELLGFPTGKHDDFVDTAAYAALQVVRWSAEPAVKPRALPYTGQWADKQIRGGA